MLLETLFSFLEIVIGFNQTVLDNLITKLYEPRNITINPSPNTLK